MALCQRWQKLLAGSGPGADATAAGRNLLNVYTFISPFYMVAYMVGGGSVAEWLACWSQAQEDPGSYRSRDAVG